jgi:hypothetical protein
LVHRSSACAHPGSRAGSDVAAWPYRSSPAAFLYADQAFSSARAGSFAATPKRASANIVARTLTWGSTPRPMCPHAGHLKTGLEMCRVERMRLSMSSSSSRSPSNASMDRSSRQRRRTCSTILGNQTRCASPAATAHHLRLVPIPSGWRPSPDHRQDRCARDHSAGRVAAAASDPETRVDREWGDTARVRSLPAYGGT